MGGSRGGDTLKVCQNIFLLNIYLLQKKAP